MEIGVTTSPVPEDKKFYHNIMIFFSYETININTKIIR